MTNEQSITEYSEARFRSLIEAFSVLLPGGTEGRCSPLVLRTRPRDEPGIFQVQVQNINATPDRLVRVH
jgi:hypothetical protein